MSSPLQLEYIVTEADQKSAKELHAHQNLGGGPKWRSKLILWIILAGAMVLMYVRYQAEVKPQHRPYFWGLVILVLILLKIFQRYNRQQPTPIQLTVSERELVLESGGGRVAMPWSSFGKLLESHELFVLLDRPKRLLYIIPKRAFPDAPALDWFRILALNAPSAPNDFGPEPVVPPPTTTTDGITLNFTLKYRDYLVRNLTSWRMRGIALLIFAVTVVAVAGMVLHPDPQAVHGPGATLAIMLPILTGMLMVLIAVVTLYEFYQDRKYHEEQLLILSADGIAFAAKSSRGVMPWRDYECYLENRWCFILWNRRALWYLLPKRAFISEADQARCRHWLQSNLRNSHWFFL